MGDEDEEGGILRLSETQRVGSTVCPLRLFLGCTMVLYIPEGQLWIYDFLRSEWSVIPFAYPTM